MNLEENEELAKLVKKYKEDYYSKNNIKSELDTIVQNYKNDHNIKNNNLDEVNNLVFEYKSKFKKQNIDVIDKNAWETVINLWENYKESKLKEIACLYLSGLIINSQKESILNKIESVEKNITSYIKKNTPSITFNTFIEKIIEEQVDFILNLQEINLKYNISISERKEMEKTLDSNYYSNLKEIVSKYKINYGY